MNRARSRTLKQKTLVESQISAYQKTGKAHLLQKLPFPFTLLFFALIKIGQIPQILMKLLLFVLEKVLVSLRIFLSKLTLLIPKLRRGRGRPRLQPLLPFYAKKIRKFILAKVPKSHRVKIAVALVITFLVTYSLFLSRVISELPSPNRLASSDRPLTTQILDRNGKVLYQIYEGQNRKLVKLSDLPPYLIKATIAIEDKHFYLHPGFDVIGIIRALASDIFDGERQGGSTITQQLVKNALLNSDQTLARKLKELFLAVWAEQIYSKDQILQMYFNEAPYGGPAWGVEAAAEMYFGKQASDLNLAESAFLAGLPAAPTEYSPYGIHPEEGKARQKEVLKRMVEDGYITQKQADDASLEQLSFKPPATDIKAPHFVMYVRSLLAAKYGERTVSQGGLKVTTTLDLDIQQMAERVVADQVAKLANLKVTNGAAVVADAETGQILAMVGSKDYWDPAGGNFNVALSVRPPGSSIKVVTYATAFKQGFSPGTVLLDTPTTFTNPWGQSYTPVNYDGKFHGPVPIRTALGSSYNIPAAKTLALVGIPNMLATARDMGITTFNKPQDYGLSLTLGGSGVKMIDMMSVYGTLATEGVRNDPVAILTVTDPYGNILEDNRKNDGQRILTEQVAYLLDNILADNNARTPAFGPNSLLQIPGHTVAVKTGTSDDKRDNWAFGFTPEYVVGAWVGNNDNSPMDPSLSSGITGATPIWHDIMASLLSDRPDIAFTRPSGIIETNIDGHQDLAIAGQVPKTVISYKKEPAKNTQSPNAGGEIITYTDPFGAYVPNSSQNP